MMTSSMLALCMALSIFGSVPDGHLPLVIKTEYIQVFVYEPEEKKLIVRLINQYCEVNR